MSNLDLDSIREHLRERRSQLFSDRSAKLAEVESSADHNTSDTIDLASESLDFDLAVSAVSRESEELIAVQDALDRIEAGTYGLCEDCEQPILPRRLEAIPFVRLCIECQREFERHGGYASSPGADDDR